MDLSREDEYFEWVDRTDVRDDPPRIIRQAQVSALRVICMDDTDDDEIEFPTYDDIKWNNTNEDQVPMEEYDAQVEYYLRSPPLQPAYLEDDISLCSTPTILSPLDHSPVSELSDLPEHCDITETVDDIAVQTKPLQHVDYLAHNWSEEDLWASWKYIHSNCTAYENGKRLENASWRCWAKQRMNLKTIAPETVDWEKDRDTTWLYGPLHKEISSRFQTSTSEDSDFRSKLTRSVSYADVNVRPILKQRRICDILLKRSSTAPPSMECSLPSLTSGRSSPSSISSRKCVRFHDEVEQFIALNTAYQGEGISRYAMGGFAVEEDVFRPTSATSQPPSKSGLRIVAKLPNSTLKNAGEVNSISAVMHNLQDSLKYDHFILPRFDYEDYESNANDDDEWELSMIGMDLKPHAPLIPAGSVY